MPLTELLRMFTGEMDATQERTSTSSDPSTRPGTDFCELVWENGQIMMQGQSHRAKKGPGATDFQSLVPKPQDVRDGNGLKMSKFGAMDSMLGDFPLSVPSCEMGLEHDGETVPWLNYAVEGHLHNDYACDFLPELSGVTINDISTESQLAFRDKSGGQGQGQGHGHGGGNDTSGGLRYSGNVAMGAMNTEKYIRNGSGEVPQFTLSAQNNVPRSGVSGITGDNVSNTHRVASRDLNPSSLCEFASLRLQKMDAAQPSTSSGLTNFPYFSRPAAVLRASHLNVSPSKRLGTDEQRCGVVSGYPADSTLVNLASGSSQKEVVADNQSAAPAPVNENSAALTKRPPEEQPSAKKFLHKEKVTRNDNNLAIDATMSKVGDRIVEPAGVTSSVCSGNSVDRASNERAYDLKRKSRETADSEGPSDEVDDESVGAKKVAHARTSSKRSRAAEVHNLSERRRRDRINEKMRSLQELIPNCNKVDKASMLDEAIEYLKTLQLQVQMLSMGAGMYMHPAMLPPGMQPIHGTTMPHFSPMGLGMGVGLGFGLNMLDVNSSMKMLPFQGAHYPVPGAVGPFPGVPGSSLRPLGHPVQGLQMPMQRAPVNPMPGTTPLDIPVGLNVSNVAGSTAASQLAPINISKDVNPQSSKEGILQSAVNASASPVAASGTNSAAS